MSPLLIITLVIRWLPELSPTLSEALFIFTLVKDLLWQTQPKLANALVKM